VKPLEELDQKLAQFVQEAKSGLIYVAYGSILSGSRMPEEKRREISKALQRVGDERGIKAVWKWESEEMEGKPHNVLLQKWLPQQDIIGKLTSLDIMYHSEEKFDRPQSHQNLHNSWGFDECHGIHLSRHANDCHAGIF